MSLISTQNTKGFTLIELLIVVAIVGALAGIVVISVGSSADDASDSVRKANMRVIGTLYAQMLAQEATEGVLDHKENFCRGNIHTDNPRVDRVEKQMGIILQEVVGQRKSAGGDFSGTVNGYMSGRISGNKVPVHGCVSSISGWVVWNTLESGKFWCVDSIGSAGEKSTKRNIGSNLAASELECSALFS